MFVVHLLFYHLDNTAYGENLASNYGTGSWGKQREPDKILVRWVDNEADVGWPDNAHLTQALWRATKYVGCDVASKEFGGGMCHTQVCRYARSGMPSLRTNLPTASNCLISYHVISSTLYSVH
jgi:hypothetical protein